VVVVQLPAEMDAAAEQALFHEVERCMEADRPCVVLDFSLVTHLSDVLVYRLLCCLEEAMKRNGDVKLAGVRPDAKATLAFAGVSRLFEIYATTAEATQSFRHRSHAALLSAFDDTELELKAESVA
jgi:anti-anti-sigma factor